MESRELPLFSRRSLLLLLVLVLDVVDGTTTVGGGGVFSSIFAPQSFLAFDREKNKIFAVNLWWRRIDGENGKANWTFYGVLCAMSLEKNRLPAMRDRETGLNKKLFYPVYCITPI